MLREACARPRPPAHLRTIAPPLRLSPSPSPSPQLHLYQILPVALVERAKVWMNKLVLKPEWMRVMGAYFSAPGKCGAWQLLRSLGALPAASL